MRLLIGYEPIRVGFFMSKILRFIQKLLDIKKAPTSEALVTRQGLEPWTHTLKVYCSTN